MTNVVAQDLANDHARAMRDLEPRWAVARIVGTIGYEDRRPWAERVQCIDRRGVAGPVFLRRVLSAARDSDAVVVSGSVGLRAGYVDLLAAAAVARRHPRPAVIVAECTWHPGRTPAERLTRQAGIRLLGQPNVAYCVLSRDEHALFARTWRLDPRRVHVTAYHFTMTAAELALPTVDDGLVFAGGDSMRDYEPLIEAARHVPAPVVIASRRKLRGPLPANLRAGPLPHARFLQTLHRASIVVVPFTRGLRRSAGQQTYLNAMALGKLVVVTDGLGVGDYLEHGRTALIVPPGDAASLAAALRWALDPANGPAVARIREQGRAIAHARFTPEAYVNRLLDVVNTVFPRQPRIARV
jgi:hypothetical protein